MYVHIGKEIIIPSDEIITILDLEKMLEKENLEDILKKLKLENNIINISEGNNKSLILIKKDENVIGYITNISSQTIAKRNEKEKI